MSQKLKNRMLNNVESFSNLKPLEFSKMDNICKKCHGIGRVARFEVWNKITSKWEWISNICDECEGK